jgi:enoyl-CoA hydratase/carnithine racemase
MNTIHQEYKDHTAILRLSRGVVNAINREMVAELSQTLWGLRRDADVRALVLTSANQKFFSIGLDIPELFPLSRVEFASFFRAFERLCIDLFTFPKPTVAAVTGHATAGGCILALCCDYRLIAEGKKLMGLNEIKLGVPVPYPADCILRHLVGSRFARNVMYLGEFFQSRELLEMGLVDEIAPPEEIIARAATRAASLGSSPPQAFAAIKDNRVEKVTADILAHLDKKEQFFVASWYSPLARQRLQEAMEKFSPRS